MMNIREKPIMIILMTLTKLIPLVTSQYKCEGSNYTTNSTFKANLNTLLSSLPATISDKGFRSTSAGTHPDTVNAIALCRDNVEIDTCRSCIWNATVDILNFCPTQNQAYLWRELCMLRYSNERIMFEELVLPPLPPPPGKDDERKSSRIVIIIVVPIGGLVGIAIGVVCSLFIRRRMKLQPQDNVESCDAESLHYDFNTLREATNHFSEANKLGQGGFGVVYKGKLSNGQEIAVKRLIQRLGHGDLICKNEVLLVATLQHENLVRLLGYCLKQTERILVYEFVQNASLDHFIFDPIRRQLMNWDTRYNIIKDIAKGLVYLHEDSQERIIHRDLKLSNVLLDENMNAKVADFGLARLVMQYMTHDTTSRVAGTYGYMAPEYAFRGHFSIKSDVFAFGVMVLEIISGQKNGGFRDEHQNVEHLLSYAWRNWQDESGKNVVDPALRDDIGFADEILRCIHIGLLCVQENATDRPTMGSALQMLINSSSQILPTPLKPGFFMQGGLDGDFANARELEPSGASAPTLSRNDISMSTMYPR